jgi:hypothetical protein
MTEWNAMTYAGKATILQVVQDEASRMFALAGQPGAWDAPTACESWRVKDVIGHLVDTTEGYFRSFEIARSGGGDPAAFGLAPGTSSRAPATGSPVTPPTCWCRSCSSSGSPPSSRTPTPPRSPSASP